MEKSKLSVVRAAVDDVIGAALERHPSPEPITRCWDQQYNDELLAALEQHGWTLLQWERAIAAVS